MSYHTPLKEITQKYHHDQIVGKCKHLFFEKDYREITSDEIAKFAGYSKRTIYAYFDSKKEIYDSVVVSSLHVLSDWFRTGEFGGLKELLAAIVSFKDTHPEDYFFISQKTFCPQSDEDVLLFQENVSALVKTLVNQHGFSATNTSFTIILWNTIMICFEGGMDAESIQRFILHGIET